jgi:GcrA cell cycle regulator
MSTWTDARTESLKRMWDDGESCSQIAKNLGGVTRNAVIGKVHRLGLSGRVTATKRIEKRKGVRGPVPTVKSSALRRPPKWRALPAPDGQPLPETRADDIARVSLMDLQPHHCRWIPGDPKLPGGAGYCGLPKAPGVSYCHGHAMRAYEAPAGRVAAAPFTIKGHIRRIAAA